MAAATLGARHEVLPAPYATPPRPDGVTPTPAVVGLVKSQVRALLDASPAWSALPSHRREQVERDLVQIASYAAELHRDMFATSQRLGQTPVLYREQDMPVLHEPDGDGVLARAAADEEGPPPPPPAEEFSPRAANQVARVTEATLNAIAFPTFVADLIQGTFRAIVDASIQQMEAFAELLANVAKTVDQFESDNITDNQARDYLASAYPAHLRVDASGEAPKIVTRPGYDERPSPRFKDDFGLSQDVPLDDDVAEEVLVPAARRKLAQQRHQLLSTMLLMGLNRVIVTSGRIRAQMGFRINARDTARAATASEFDFKHDTVAGGWFGVGGAAHRTSVAYVSSTQKDSDDELEVGASLTGEVDLKFKSDVFPLERFADTGVIMQIQQATPNPAANTPVTGGREQKRGGAE
jgi:hypothetical protein